MSIAEVELDADLLHCAEKVIRKVPGWSTAQPEFCWMSGGGAHKNLMASDGDRKCMLKLWNTTWEALAVIPPSGVAMENTRLAGEIGIGAPVLSICTDPLALVVEYLPSTLLDISDRAGRRRLLSTARRLHDSKIRFARDFSPFSDARAQFACARQRGVDLPDGYAELTQVMQRVEKVLDLRVGEFVPCHNDLYGPNILVTTSGEVRLVDYDLSGNGDRCYDLGFISTYGELDEEAIAELCEDYFGEANPHIRARVTLFALAADYCSLGLWTVAQGASNRNIGYDYMGELCRSLNKVRRRINAVDFGTLLEVAAR
ncbi:MAG TPA: phosphotransferase [Candidatus Sulfotelmatobacter sp.]|nr:phosphotransferase [Candidatus Sulfotelmatobacter sp.]